MVKFCFQYVYKHPWELVTHTHLTKYPTEKERNIVGADITDTNRGPYNFYLKVVVTCLNAIPSVFRKLKVLDVPNICYVEECWLDMENRLMKVSSMPSSFQEYANMKEYSVFKPMPENPNWTLFEQQGTIEIKGLGRMSWLIEMFAEKFLTRGARRNVVIMEELMQEKLSLFREPTN